VFANVVVGAVSVHQRKLRLKDLRRGGSLAREAAHHVAHEAVEPVHS
jgi:glycosyltransferase 2 family protein